MPSSVHGPGFDLHPLTVYRYAMGAFMRHIGFLLIACPLAVMAQTNGESPVLQSLLTEVQQLRMAIERSTLLGARTQLAISNLQLQEARTTRLSAEHGAAREMAAANAQRKAQIAANIREMETATPPPGKDFANDL